MIATWMVYSIAIGLLIGGAALVAERAARALGLPVRMLWAAACLATLLWPVAACLIVRFDPAAGPTRRVVADNPTVQRLAPVHISAASFRFSLQASRSALSAGLAATESSAASLDRPLLIGWLLAAMLLFARLVWSIGRLSRRRQSWTAADLDGIAVLISPDTGPAVIGLGSMAIVIPQWLFDLDTSLRAVVLRHEEEHRRAGDPYLLCAAAIAGVVMPWNVALRWHARRLRLAVEIDCDARVLRDDLPVDRYGALLMAIAQHHSANLPKAIAALAESPSQLERRIEVMTMRPRKSRVAGLLLAGGAAILIAVACAAPAPDEARDVATAQREPKGFAVVPDSAILLREPRGPRLGDSALALMRLELPRGPYIEDDAGAVIEVKKFRLPAAIAAPEPPKRFTRRGTPTTPRQSSTVPSSLRPEPTPAPQAVRRLSFYTEAEVDKPVQPAAGNRAPTYPASLRVSGVEGKVIVRFVVDTMGKADVPTAHVLSSADPLFTAAVLQSLAGYRFVPARKHGVKVPQVIEMPFIFSLSL